MRGILIANIVGLLAPCLNVTSGMTKTAKRSYIIQNIAMGLFILANAIAGSIIGMCMNIIGMSRNTLAIKNKLNHSARRIIIVLCVAIGCMANNLGIIGLLPVIANVMFTAYMDNNPIRLKKLLCITMLMWTIHDGCIGLYTSMAFDIITAVAAAVSLKKMQNSHKLQQAV